MERKLLYYSHPKYRNIGIKEIEDSINEKKYPWGDIEFELIELNLNSTKIPIYFRKGTNYFDYLEDKKINIPKKINLIKKINQFLII